MEWGCHILSHFFNPSLKIKPKSHQRPPKLLLTVFFPVIFHIKRVPARFYNIIFPFLFQLFCHDLCTAATIPQHNSNNNGVPIWGRRNPRRAVWLWKLHLQLWACRVWHRFNPISILQLLWHASIPYFDFCQSSNSRCHHVTFPLISNFPHNFPFAYINRSNYKKYPSISITEKYI